MTTPAGELLVRYLLDEAFRDRFDRDPAATIDGAGVTGAERDVLLAGDDRMLYLIGSAIRAEAPAGDKPPRPTVAATEDSGPTLAAIQVWLRAVPHPTRDDDGNVHVRWAVSIHAEAPVPGAPQPGAPDPAFDAGIPEVSFRVDIQPRLQRVDGAVHVAFPASLTPVLPPDAQHADAPSAVAPSAAVNAFGHDITSPAVQAAARAVTSADPSGRYPRIIDLIAAMKGVG